MNNELRQYPAEQFITQGRRLVDALGQVDNKTFYPALKIEVDREKSLFHFYKQVQSLRNQQAIIGQQLDSLIGQEPVENYLEIGTQGTYINYLKQSHSIERADILSEQSSMTDYLHGTSWSIFR